MRHRLKQLDAATIKNSISPFDFYLSEQRLSHFGARSNNWVTAGLCPFHDDNRPGSFFINLATGAFNCFSCAGKGRDIIAFIMKKYNLSFREALEFLYKGGGLL